MFIYCTAGFFFFITRLRTASSVTVSSVLRYLSIFLLKVCFEYSTKCLVFNDLPKQMSRKA